MQPGVICRKWLDWVCANVWTRLNVKKGVAGKAGFICIIKVDTTHQPADVGGMALTAAVAL